MTCTRILSGEMHYPRIPRPYWRERLRMARAMGLNAISTYVFWNVHEPEPGRYDFSGDYDLRAYLQIAQEEELNVILRPGPYVCAEWDFGGLPAWLLRDGAAIRTEDESYMAPVRRWLARLGEELLPMQPSRGGPIVAVQLENEYGAFGSDARYLRALRAALQEARLTEAPLFTIDQPGDLAAGSLDGVPIAVTFAPGDAGQSLTAIREFRPAAPLLVGEYWAGWFDHWGEARARRDDALQVRDLELLLARGASVNVYMFHGGTNFGFWNGANSSESQPYQPTITSYDYEAVLDEAGRPTPKYFAFRERIARATGTQPKPVPSTPQTRAIAEFSLTACAPLETALGQAVSSDVPLAMEDAGQYYGFMLYRTRLLDAPGGVLELEDLRDYAVVSVDGLAVAHLDRRSPPARTKIAASRGATLDILVENCGRINYGPDLPFERKGVTKRVLLDGQELRGWEMFPVCAAGPAGLPFESGVRAQPAFYKGSFTVEAPADTFLDVTDLGKGVLWVNGRCAGRFWNVGPQRSLYVPGAWLHAGENEAFALDLFGRSHPARLRGVSEPLH